VKNRKIIYTIISLLFAVGFYFYDNFYNINTSKNSNHSNLNNLYLPTSTTDEIVHHKYYTLSYKEAFEQAEWVAYSLTSNQIVHNNFKRPYFTKDPKVKTQSANYWNYKNSGFDKGHLCPAADRKFSKQAFNETFLTSNISPQKHNFNSGIWNVLEQKERYWAKKYKKLYIITGGILNANLETIGSEKIAVPNYFYKIILNYANPNKLKAIAFIIPNKSTKKPLSKFVSSIDKIEHLTGINFFEKLPDQIENRLEKSTNYYKWTFN
jgi:endonuclease G